MNCFPRSIINHSRVWLDRPQSLFYFVPQVKAGWASVTQGVNVNDDEIWGWSDFWSRNTLPPRMTKCVKCHKYFLWLIFHALLTVLQRSICRHLVKRHIWETFCGKFATEHFLLHHDSQTGHWQLLTFSAVHGMICQQLRQYGLREH